MHDNGVVLNKEQYNMRIPISFLDLVPIGEGQTAATAIAQSVQMAQMAEQCGFKRFWLAEHHNMPGIASAATSLLLCHLGNHTQRIRLGSGGIMLPNHSPLVIAEQFGTLESLFPNRIDLGLGRAPGSDLATADALHRTMEDSERFPDDVLELQAYLQSTNLNDTIRAIPGQGLNIPLWILGSSLYGAQMAAYFGLPYAFASHFAPQMLKQAIHVYRSTFRPSQSLAKPYVSIAANLLLSDSIEEARYQFTSKQQSFVQLRRGNAGLIPKPIKDMESYWNASEKDMAASALSCSFVGTVASQSLAIEHFLSEFAPDELIVTCGIYDQATRLKTLQYAQDLPMFSFES